MNDVSFIINQNEKISIVGENGAGKSTLIKLLLRLYTPTEGAIYFNGMDISKLSYDDYMKLFSVVFQDFKFFALSISDNISFGEGNEAEILKCLKQSGIDSKINGLPNGIQTNLYKIFDKTGVELSGGETQKLALSKALYKDAPIMILDEPTSALDPRAEYELFQNFNNYTDDKVAIYISHRLSSCKFSDKILVLKAGQLVEHGNHSELLDLNGLYSELFSMQANSYVS
ncbi:MAG: hypothetical protein ATN33_00720 [Epulopiscium sp. Nele67-Bin001]|nr:MAG: hypothetical protein ATN33_00720 [Epulopiscium sp. Nele67-Bin001]